MDEENKIKESGNSKPEETLNEGKETPAEELNKSGKETEVPEEEDISEMIEVLNAGQKTLGSGEDITDVPKNLRGSIKYLIEKLVFVRDLYRDPLWLKILDDMADQKEDGKTPSLEVAIARNVPLERLQDLADNENYEDVQNAVGQRLEADKAAEEKESGLYSNFNESEKNGREYCEEMGYDDAELQELFGLAMKWFKILGDGLISKDDWSSIDNMRNYKNDVTSLRDQLPKQPAKEVLPDQSSAQSITPMQNRQQQRAPSNSIEAMSRAMSAEPSYIKPRPSTRGNISKV